MSSLGEMAPAMAEVTLERVAACAVLAGCRPEYFPVVVAAVQAALEPAFNVGGQAVTTQPVGQVVVVNGPVRDAIGLNGGVGALGPGWRANMTIGRALRLVVSLTGGGFPGRLDRSTLANPGKVGLCFAEDEEVSPWEPLHVERGFPADAFGRDRVRGGRAAVDLRPPQHLARGAGARAGRGGRRHLEPELVAARRDLAVRPLPRARPLFAEWGWSKQRVREAMFEASAARRASCAGARRRRWCWPRPTISSSPSGRAPRTS